VGFDLGGSKMLAVVYDGQMQPRGRKRTRTKGLDGARAGIERIVDTIGQALEDVPPVARRLCGIGIGCPGPLDLDRGVLIDAPNLGWKDVHLKEAVEKRFACPAIILNDVDAGIYGEYAFGSAQGSRCALGVFPGTGIGGGCVYEGTILRGATSSCMEIGHMQILPEGPVCGCGRRGCLEAVAGRLAIAAAAAAAAHRGEAPHLRLSVGLDVGEIRSAALARAIDAGDDVVERIVRQAASYIGIAVANAVHLLAPDTVVLGGGLVEAMPQLFVEEVHRTAQQRVMPSFADSFRVVAGTLGDDASVLGAAAWARQCVTQVR
jgi:glucokinase